MYPSFRPLLAAALVSLAACQKAPVEPAGPISLVGRWAFTQTTGGIAGITYQANSSQRREIDFAPNGQAQFLLNGAVLSTTSYMLIPVTQRPRTFVEYANGRRDFIKELTATRLVLDDNFADFADGFVTTYARQAPTQSGQ